MIRFWRRKPETLAGMPKPPQNVRVVLPDGREIPVELVYGGFHEQHHQWFAAWPVGLSPTAPGTVRWAVDVLPAHSAIVIGFAHYAAG